MRLSACLIVRDEELALPRCLASIVGDVDEIVVVDTGSRDRTIEIAKSFGARVVEWAWRDDFAAARNVSIEHATGDWILFVDADNAFPKGEIAKARRLLEGPKIAEGNVDACVIDQHEANGLDASVDDVVSGARRAGEPTLAVMFARRAPHIRYRGIVHESLMASVCEGGGRGGVLRTVRAAHYGSLHEVRDAKQKDARNERLLRRRLDADPGDTEAAGYLSIALLDAERGDDADCVIDDAWRCLAESRATGEGIIRLAMARALRAGERTDHAAVIESIDLATERAPAHPDAFYLRGNALASLGRFEEAVADFDRAIALRGAMVSQSFLVGVRDVGAPLARARSLVELGRHAEALSSFDEALARMPDAADSLHFERAACAAVIDLAA